MLDRLPFVKLSGAGNDFIAVAAQDCRDVDPGWLASRLCRRALSLGGDGLIVVEPLDAQAVRIRFFNPDGSLAEMCGNGSRCAARYAVEQRLVSGDTFRLVTDSGDLPVVARPDGRFEVVMPEPDRIQFNHMEVDPAAFSAGEVVGQRPTASPPAHLSVAVPVHACWVGVPHAVVIVPETAIERMGDEDVIRLGRSLRYDAERFPAGTNVNVAELRPDGVIRLRTYERGVENLTKACGTGSTATAFVVNALFGDSYSWPIDLCVDGGRLAVDRREGRLWLSGDARLIATGTIGGDAFGG